MAWQPSAELLDDLMVAALAADDTGRIVYANRAATALFGSGPDDLVGSMLRERLFEEAEVGAAEEISARVLMGATWSGELSARCSGQHVRELATSWSPVYDGKRVTGVLLLAEDTQHARILTRRLNRLANVSTDLLAARTLQDVARVVTDEMTDAAGATVGSISLVVDDETLTLVAIKGGTPGVADRWTSFPRASRTPAAECLRNRRVLVLHGRDEIAARYPDLERAATGERSMVCLPLVVGDRELGAVTMSFPGRRRFDAPELAFLTLLSEMCAHAIDRIQAQAAAHDRETKLAFLAEATVRLSGDLDYETTLAAVAEAAVPWFADWCAVVVAEDGRLRTIAFAHADTGQGDLVDRLQTDYPPEPDAYASPGEVLRTGQSVLVPDITDEMLEARAVDDEHLRLLRDVAPRSMMSCPLIAGDRALGVVTWVAGEGSRRFDADDLAFAEDLARRAAIAIDNAQLHSEVRDVALRLQHAVLPERLPRLAGWETAVVYQPSGRTDAGGDFYDVVDLGGGRIAAFVGDVMGRGVQAASVMAQMRSAIRTLIALDPAPESVLTGLDLVFDRLDLEHLVTIAYALADPAAGTLELISAGHPAPLLLRPGGSIEVVTHAETMLLGAGGGARNVVTVPFDPGDVALLFTDGLVERRGEDTDAGMDRLVDACRRIDAPALDTWLEAVVDEVRDPTRDDDVAALAVRRG
ncbi:SpoIIE family protein phosphatase [Nocardioides sp. URHA0032]|uniref:SpoIIE family protein phosphatase n=1 Tax=Nocardioides sp. URHA0032 TaxID=1380388 RepID=UPI000491B6E4|nr:SpoIIE family protein phosphatase [Nocardioides sp. URHA0032]